jgi:hypothetical protein
MLLARRGSIPSGPTKTRLGPRADTNEAAAINTTTTIAPVVIQNRCVGLLSIDIGPQIQINLTRDIRHEIAEIGRLPRGRFRKPR